MEISTVHDISILHLFGEISFSEMDEIEKTLNSLRQMQHKKVLIDFSSVDHIHFAVVNRLVNQANALRACDGDLKIVRQNLETKNIFRFIGADQSFEDYQNLSDALLSFVHAPCEMSQ